MPLVNNFLKPNIDENNNIDKPNNPFDNICNNVFKNIVNDKRDPTHNQIRSKKAQSVYRVGPLPKRTKVTKGHMLTDFICAIVEKIRKSRKKKIITVLKLAKFQAEVVKKF